MDYIWFIVLLFFLHYLADFSIQPYTWKKPENCWRTLVTHTITYMFVLIFGLVVLEAIFPALAISHSALLGFIGVNSVAHFLTDLITRKLTGILRVHNELTAYINVVALDQCLHYITLLISFGFYFVK